MTIEIKKPVTKEKLDEAIARFNKHGKKKSLRKHFACSKGISMGWNIRNK